MKKKTAGSRCGESFKFDHKDSGYRHLQPTAGKNNKQIIHKPSSPSTMSEAAPTITYLERRRKPRILPPHRTTVEQANARARRDIIGNEADTAPDENQKEGVLGKLISLIHLK